MQTTYTPRVEEAPQGVFLPIVHVVGWYRLKLVNHPFKMPGSADTHEEALQLARLHTQRLVVAHHRSSAKIADTMR
ncbi:hypothetical protein [Hydrogenophaga sp.]|uniref:hypothetical protein n=1 Tax=Hydrogenophaga sp. TaxID=1904254 RepID=UPI0008C3BD45|nr:hypothetical protein [Hydrogenophaga sp.]OGA77198.1 MAG: hypothetical protein A2X73_12520 [Burkholderiales bacterium GWE1_65_30]